MVNRFVCPFVFIFILLMPFPLSASLSKASKNDVSQISSERVTSQNKSDNNVIEWLNTNSGAIIAGSTFVLCILTGILAWCSLSSSRSAQKAAKETSRSTNAQIFNHFFSTYSSEDINNDMQKLEKGRSFLQGRLNKGLLPHDYDFESFLNKYDGARRNVKYYFYQAYKLRKLDLIEHNLFEAIAINVRGSDMLFKFVEPLDYLGFKLGSKPAFDEEFYDGIASIFGNDIERNFEMKKLIDRYIDELPRQSGQGS